MCSKKTKKGTVDFVEENLPAGTYQLCMCFYANKPYSKFVCSDTFKISSSNGGDDDDSYYYYDDDDF
jgi:hypothetical protein